MSLTTPRPSIKGQRLLNQVPINNIISISLYFVRAPRRARHLTSSRSFAACMIDGVAKPSQSRTGTPARAKTHISGPDVRVAPPSANGPGVSQCCRPEGTGPWTACLPQLCTRGISRQLPTLCLCLCDADPLTSKSVGGISSALRQTAGSRPLSLTTHVVATSPAQFYLLDPARYVTSFGGPHPLEGLSTPYSEGYILSQASPHILWLTLQDLHTSYIYILYLSALFGGLFIS